MGADTGHLNLNLNISRLSISPDFSSDTSTAPKTPDFLHHFAFGPGGGILTPTPPPSAEAPAVFSTHAAMTSASFPESAIGLELRDHIQAAGNIWSFHNSQSSFGNGNGIANADKNKNNNNNNTHSSTTSIAQTGNLSHIWANSETTRPHVLTQVGQNMYWGPTESSIPRHGASAAIDHVLSPQQQQLQQQLRMTSGNAPVRNLNNQMPPFASSLALFNTQFSSPARLSETQQAPGIHPCHAQKGYLASTMQPPPPFVDNLGLTASFINGFHHAQPAGHGNGNDDNDGNEDNGEENDADGGGGGSAAFDFHLPHQFVPNLGVDILRISPHDANNARRAMMAMGQQTRPWVPEQAPIPAHHPLNHPHSHQVPAPPPPPHPATAAFVTGSGFTPMHAVNEQTRSLAPPRVISNRFSTRYHGMHTEANASAEHLSSEQNCALWLTNLPPDVTPKQLLGAIRKVGRIWCSFINYPDYLSHHTAAAKVVFFSPRATQQFLSDSWTKGLYMGSQRVRVSHNRIKSESKEAELITLKSRVLIITGRAEFVNEAYLAKYFKDRFIFQNDDVTELINVGGRAVIEWRFGSYRCQAQMGKMSLEKDRPYWLEKVEFGEDPCEVGDTYSSYGVAAERIQGRGL